MRCNNTIRYSVGSVLVLGMAIVSQAHATNGMNLEGWGPVSKAMGGVGSAIENGTAAVMNNPATLGLMDDGSHRVDLAVGFLGPDVSVDIPGLTAQSDGNAYWMPALGYAQRNGQFTYGVGLFSQGGMGTDYKADSFLAAGSGEEVRSELSVGRLILPLAFQVNDKFTIGGTLDGVWGGMDLKMAMSGAQFGDFVADLGGTQTYGTASGTMVDGLVGMINAGVVTNVNWTRFDFSNSSSFSGKARGYGVGGKLGFTYQLTPQFRLGASYHTKVKLSDMKADGTTVSMSIDADLGAGPSTYEVPVQGEIRVKDFAWPAAINLGLAYQATDKLLLAADLKQYQWSDVMGSFNMSFHADASQSNPVAAGFAGATMDTTLYQDWDDQTVIALGAAYRASDQLTLRAGYNHANNPVPDFYVNPLFPAIVKSAVTAGMGYQFNDRHSVDFAISFVPEETVTSSTGLEISHSQTNFQIMYSNQF
ncbi:MAG: aromatic hydrocarbon degradation protein [Gammaproteobacteria bacterium]|nr:aromatic hydrocarbon degradation protein [Gammaproteobacteria bacterium]